ncbi:unnamed protein product [Cylindrotheca closterium]|uniref:Plus3 domain-containing protein n=1 Tax=Cylindrotheca closterium TaxID=2856 RepID=A0AAD2FQT2_9STRA|nr:unnamed protein product [Cylindrotheca closterium]
MPNIKRRFKDDDPSSDEDEEEEEEEPTYHPSRGVGKALRMPGGKGFGKQLRPPPQDDDSEEESEDDEDEEPPQPAFRQGGGKQLRPPVGKMLRPPPQDDDSDDDDDDDDDMEEDEPVRPVQRGGGKSLMRMRAPSDDEDEDDESDKEEEEAPTQRIVQRGGGKSLMRMQANQQDDSDEDESSEEEEPTRVVPRTGGGKQLRPPSGGNQLRRGGGKQLRPQPADDDDDESDEEEEAPQPVQVVRRGGGKSLMRMQAPDSDSDDDEEPPKAAATSEDQADKKAPEDIEEAAAAPDEEDSSDEDGMDVDSDDEQPTKKTTPAPEITPKPKEPEVEEESEDEESSDEEEAEFDNETFDPQKLVNDEEDQKYLDSLPELEREAILGERFEKRKADMDMKKALRDAKRKEKEEKAAKDQKAGKKRKASTRATTKKTTPAKKNKAAAETADDETIAKSLASKRGSTRNRDATGSKAKKAEALAALREERKKVTRKDSSDSESSFGDDDDDDSDDDYEESGNAALRPWQKKAAESRKSRLDQVEESDDEMEHADVKDDDDKYAEDTQRVVQEAELEDYLKITVSRRKLGRWCNEPFFKKSVVGCFVKLFIGENDQGKRCYRLCRIVDVQPAPKGSYALPAVKKEKPVVTDKALKLQFGKNERIFLIKLISDNKATETDVNLYKTEMKNQRQQVLSRKEANKIRRKQDSLVSNYTYTTEDIEDNLRKIKKKGGAMKNLGLEQTRAAIAVQAARAELEEAIQEAKSGDGDNSAVGAAEKVLEEKLEEERRVLDKVKNRKEKLTSRGKDKKWAKVNKRALEMNQKLDRGALNDPEEQKVEGGAKPKFNPYARRKVKPKILWEVGQKEEEEEEKKESSQVTDENAEKEADSTPNLVQEQQQKAAALSQSHQFAIDEETLAQSSYTSGIAGLTAKKPVRKRVRKGLSLNEYLERKEAGTL